MRIRTLATVMAAAGICAWGERPKASATEYSVIVCMNAGARTVGWGAALPHASTLFGEIGVRIDWRYGPHDCDSVPGIVVTLLDETPTTKQQDALAYAQPYEGVHIEVFYDRIREKMGDARAPHLLAYVLAHEIAHILQGVSRHSETGIMKAVWGHGDYFDMAHDRMKFSQIDITLIRLGLDSRRTRLGANNRRTTLLQ